ncbi:AIG2 family [Fusarium subglutinans]|uniref:gamma-glutamylcyclotransferase n=1 Tax=Gibberella subglutinans TaxID=42677 RepID=A0A8H5P370_GIBSU|nr:AIG2 family [Fusarium subglutinans]KAF5584830.1 AIG2 family [Fusarium subglutinans]
MNLSADEAQADTGQPLTKYYFAYGSNLHLQQMKRRCPGSKFIGSGKLADHRWQINERGYANVTESQGHWVEGLVYEINPRDEARLDINEGVSKDAYQKKYMTVTLRRAEAALYRRPVSWIVNHGGPDHARVLAQQGEGQRKAINHKPHLEQNILVYISPRYIVDSEPKEEYINRINSGIVDATSLGVTNDYISNCVRPFIPAPTGQNSGDKEATGSAKATGPPKPKVVRKVPNPAKKVKQPAREVKRATPPRGRESSPPNNRAPGQRPLHLQPQVVQGQRWTRNSASNVPERLRRPSQSRPSAPPLPPRPLAPHYPGNTLQIPVPGRRRPASEVGAPPPPLPPRPTRRVRSIPVIVTHQEGYGGYWYR